MLGVLALFQTEGLLTLLTFCGMTLLLFLWPFVAWLLKARSGGATDMEDWHKRTGWGALGMAAGLYLRQFLGNGELTVAVVLALLMWGAAGVIKRG